tara:strand:+ start:230 stop:982 length:753 start_codon:yes stop_codon:yes gene_type:complete
MMRLTTLPQMGGVELWRGPSVIDGSTIGLLATLQSSNRKTGNMIQTWILREDQSPVDAVKSGADESICGGCIHRAKDGKQRSCYVNVGQAPNAIWRSWKAGKYPKVNPLEFSEYYSTYRVLRLGAYGDPAAVPFDVIADVMHSKWMKWTGYTHQWKWCDVRFKKYLMASVETLAEKDYANDLGYRTFSVLKEGEQHRDDEIICLASEDPRITCERCGLCNGASHKKNIAIPVHGVGATNFNRKMEAAYAS